MADARDEQNNRMLFTEFDLSEKGRPTTTVDESPANYIKYPIHTITDLASSLDLDFEDDADGSPAAQTAANDNNETEKEKKTTTTPTDEDHELALDIEDTPATLARLASSVIGPPTWEEFTNAYRRGAAPIAPQAEYTAAPTPAPQPKTAPAADSESTEFDVLSSLMDDDDLQPADVPVNIVDKNPNAGTDTEVLDMSKHLLPPEKPYGGIERVADWFDPPENADREILQDNWFEPPENTANDQNRPSPEDTAVGLFSGIDIDSEWNNKVNSVADSQGSDTAVNPGTRHLDLFSGLDLNSLWEEKLHHNNAEIPDTFDNTVSDVYSAADTVIIDALDLNDPEPDNFMSQEMLDAAATTVLPGDDFSKRKTRRLTRPGMQDVARRPPAGGEVDLLADLESFLDAGEAEAKEKQPQIRPAPSGPAAATAADDDGDDELSQEFGDEELSIDDYLPADGMPQKARAKPAPKIRDDAEDEELAASSPDDFLDDAFPEEAEFDGSDVAPPSISDADIQAFKRKRAAMEDDIEAAEAAARAAAAAEPAPTEKKAPARQAKAAGKKKAGGGKTAKKPKKPAKNAPEGDFDPLADPAFGEDNYDAFAEDDEDAQDAFDPLAGDGAGDDGEFGDDGMHGTTPSGEHSLTTDDFLTDMDFEDESVDGDISAPVVDDSDIDMPSRRPRPGTEEMQAIMGEGEFAEDSGDAADGEGAAAEEESGPPADEVAVNPMDVFANMDDMDFSDDFDDDMKAMLDDEEEEGAAGALNIDVDGFTGAKSEAAAPEIPTGFVGKLKYFALKALFRIIPMKYVEKVQAMIAWHENWWFYCDLLAAIIASASLAVIISYYLWYRD